MESEQQAAEVNPKLDELNALAQEYGFAFGPYLHGQEGKGLVYNYLRTKDDLRSVLPHLLDKFEDLRP